MCNKAVEGVQFGLDRSPRFNGVHFLPSPPLSTLHLSSPHLSSPPLLTTLLLSPPPATSPSSPPFSDRLRRLSAAALGLNRRRLVPSPRPHLRLRWRDPRVGAPPSPSLQRRLRALPRPMPPRLARATPLGLWILRRAPEPDRRWKTQDEMVSYSILSLYHSFKTLILCMRFRFLMSCVGWDRQVFRWVRMAFFFDLRDASIERFG